MTLIRKQSGYKKGDFMRLADVAEPLCVDAESIRTGAVGRFTLIPLNDSKRPVIVIQMAEINRFLTSRIELAKGGKGND